MDRRAFKRGGPNRSSGTVRELGQMFEELIVLTSKTISPAGRIDCRNSDSRQHILTDNNNRLTKISLTKVEKANCAQCNKSSAASVDSNHVKNRKQFFEGQTQTYEQQVTNAKPKTGISITYHTCLQRNGKPKDGCSCNVRTRRQLFEEYTNDNNKESSKTVPNSYMGKKGTSIGDLSYRSKYEPQFKYGDSKKTPRRFSHEIEAKPKFQEHKDEGNIRDVQDSSEESTPPPIPESKPPKTLFDTTDGDDYHLFFKPTKRRSSPPMDMPNNTPISNRRSNRGISDLLRKYKVQNHNDSLDGHEVIKDVLDIKHQNDDVREEDYILSGRRKPSDTYSSMSTAEIIEDNRFFNTTQQDFVLFGENKPSNKYNSMGTAEVIEDNKMFNITQEDYTLFVESKPSNAYNSMGTAETIEDNKMFNITQKDYILSSENKPSNKYNSMGTAEVIEDNKMFNITQEDYTLFAESKPSNAYNSMGTAETIEDNKMFNITQEDYILSGENKPSNEYNAMGTLEVIEGNKIFNTVRKDYVLPGGSKLSNAYNSRSTADVVEDNKMFNTAQEDYILPAGNKPSNEYNAMGTAEVIEDNKIFNTTQEDYVLPSYAHNSMGTVEVIEDNKMFNTRQEDYILPSYAYNSMSTAEVIADNKMFNTAQEDYVLPGGSKSSDAYNSMNTAEVIEDNKVFNIALEDYILSGENKPSNEYNSMGTAEVIENNKMFNTTQEDYILFDESKPSNAYNSMGTAEVIENNKMFNTTQEDYIRPDERKPSSTYNSMGTVDIIENKKIFGTVADNFENLKQNTPSSDCNVKEAAEIIEVYNKRYYAVSNELEDENNSPLGQNVPFNRYGSAEVIDYNNTFTVTQNEVLEEEQNPLHFTNIRDNSVHRDEVPRKPGILRNWCGTIVPKQEVEETKTLNNNIQDNYKIIEQDVLTPTPTCDLKQTAEVNDDTHVEDYDQDSLEHSNPSYSYDMKQTAELIEDPTACTRMGSAEVIDTIFPGASNSFQERHEAVYENVPLCTYNPSYRYEIIEEDNISNTTGGSPERDTSEDHIEECISNVTEAFQSIQTNLMEDQPKWTVWEIAKDSDLSSSSNLEDDYDIFGSLLDIDTDYCVETFNNGNENVLFKISIGREVIMKDENQHFENIYNDVDVEDKILNEDPEYYSISDTIYEDERQMTGIYFDKDKNPRIEIISTTTDQDRDLVMPHLNVPKLQQMIIRELIDSEEIYLKRMRYIIDNYLIYYRNMDVFADIEKVFGNIEEIYNKTETICTSLKNCWTIDEIALVFLANVTVFDSYTEYLRNRTKSQQYASKSFADIIRQRQIELEDQYTCDSYLLNTTHRPEQYKLLLERLNKAITKSGETNQSLEEAIILIETKMAETNTILAIDSIKYPPNNLKDMGAFLMKEKFNVKNKYVSIVFLFQGGVIFCVEDQEQPDVYEFIECIEMEKLLLRHRNSSNNFQLSWFDKSKKYGSNNQHDFDLEAPSMAVKEKWVDEIQRILWTQLQYYKDQQKNANLKPTNHIPKSNNLGTETKPSEDENKHVAEGEEVEYCNIDDPYDSENVKMSGTFFDRNENPRIQIIRTDSCAGTDLNLKNVPKVQYMIIKELLTTEKTYLSKMKHIIDSYYMHFKQNGISPEISIVFGNIDDIHTETEKLYSTLLECRSIEDIAKAFIDHIYIFELYTEYLRNKSKSYHYASTKFKTLIKERQVQLEDQYSCDSYLLNPVQRPGRYKLLLEKLEREMQKAGETCRPLTEAVRLISDKISEANTLMTIDSIDKSPVSLKKKGHFIMKEALNIKRKYKSVIFLFRDIVVFCVEDPQRADIYNYVDSIVMTELSLSHNRHSTTFRLKNFDKSKMGEESKYTFDIETPSMAAKERWIDEIQRLLWSQLQYFKDQQKRTSALGMPSPIAKKNSMRRKKKPYDSLKSSKRSTFYYDIRK